MKNSTPQMTRWFPPKTKPIHVGEYNASAGKDPTALRWWDGEHWSMAYWRSDTARSQALRRKQHAISTIISWRGLADKP